MAFTPLVLNFTLTCLFINVYTIVGVCHEFEFFTSQIFQKYASLEPLRWHFLYKQLFLSLSISRVQQSWPDCLRLSSLYCDRFKASQEQSLE